LCVDVCVRLPNVELFCFFEVYEYEKGEDKEKLESLFFQICYFFLSMAAIMAGGRCDVGAGSVAPCCLALFFPLHNARIWSSRGGQKKNQRKTKKKKTSCLVSSLKTITPGHHSRLTLETPLEVFIVKSTTTCHLNDLPTTTKKGKRRDRNLQATSFLEIAPQKLGGFLKGKTKTTKTKTKNFFLLLSSFLSSFFYMKN